MIAPHILVLSVLGSMAWATHLADCINDYIAVRNGTSVRRRGDLVIAFRRVVVAFCLISIWAAYVFRTAMVVAGLGDSTAGQVVFFALLGINVPGAIFTVVSRRYD